VRHQLFVLVSAASTLLINSALADPQDATQGVSDWIEQLGSSDAESRISAALQLSRLGPDAVAATDVLMVTLGDADPSVRAAAARALGKIGVSDVRVVRRLIEMLGDSRQTQLRRPVAFIVAGALGDIGEPALPELLSTLDNKQTELRLGAMVAISRIGPQADKAVPKLIELMESERGPLRRVAISALGAVGTNSEAAVAALIRLLSHEEFGIQVDACRALAQIGPTAEPAVSELIRLMKEGIASARRNAAAALGKIGPTIKEAGVNQLSVALADPNQVVREDAAVALGRLGPAAASSAPALEAALDDPRFDARVKAAWALWRVSGETERATEILLAAMVDFERFDDASKVLKEMGVSAETVAPRLIRLLDSRNPERRRAAAEALGRIGSDLPAIREALEDAQRDVDAKVRQEATWALQSISEQNAKDRPTSC